MSDAELQITRVVSAVLWTYYFTVYAVIMWAMTCEVRDCFRERLWRP